MPLVIGHFLLLLINFKAGENMEERRHLAERLENILVDVIESGNLDSFSNYLLYVSSLTWQLEYKMINEEEFALKMEEAKNKFLNM